MCWIATINFQGDLWENEEECEKFRTWILCRMVSIRSLTSVFLESSTIREISRFSQSRFVQIYVRHVFQDDPQTAVHIWKEYHMDRNRIFTFAKFTQEDRVNLNTADMIVVFVILSALVHLNMGHVLNALVRVLLYMWIWDVM